MAYNKKNWQDNVSDITAAELNRMEQGIYDNSLVVDAITNTINPTDTETYKTAELTEGQITDVIGVSDILIKGQTSQDETPTPSAPVDVNVVSGSNVINTSSKNLLDKDGEISQGSTNNTADTTRLSIRVKHKLKANTTYTVITNLNTSNFVWAFVLGTKVSPWSNAEQLYDSTWKNTNYWSYTTSQECYINIPIRKTSSADININDVKDYWFMLYEGAYDSNVFYEPHQGKELPLDLPVENLFDGVFRQGLHTNTTSSTRICSLNIMEAKNGESYTLSTNLPSTFKWKIMNVNTNGTTDVSVINDTSYTSSNSVSVNCSNSGYLKILVGKIDESNIAPSDISNYKFQVETGNKANAYTPYGTDPIELCKIGNYQDYFYKSGSKWYLHKEIAKIILDGTQTIKDVDTASTNTSRVYFENIINAKSNNIDVYANQLSGKFIWDTDENGIYVNSTVVVFRMSKSIIGTTIEEVNTYLSNNNIILYYLLNTATNTEITDTTLISQLEAIYNAPLYEQTNITQTNNDLPMVLDITACKDNINGIKAFIRK